MFILLYVEISINCWLLQEYEDEISSLSAELASSRDQTGVFMSSEKYQALMDQMNRQKIAIDQEKVSQQHSFKYFTKILSFLVSVHLPVKQESMHLSVKYLQTS